MSANRQLEADTYVGFHHNNTADLEESPQFHALEQSELSQDKVDQMVIQSFHKVILPKIQPMIRDIVNEKIESVHERILSSLSRNFGNETHRFNSRSMCLCFQAKVPIPIWTGVRIGEENGTSIKVALIDCLTGKVVDIGPEASAKVEIVVLEGDFDADEEQGWTREEFNLKIVPGKEGRKSPLTGNVFLKLKEGIGAINGVKFTHNSRYMKIGRFRLGARVVENFHGPRVREAKTEAFLVKDRRRTLQAKHFPPSPTSEVWRLKNIYKYGGPCDRLAKENIVTVEDFLIQFFRDPRRLQNILGMSINKWKVTLDHARTCILDERLYLYPSLSSPEHTNVVFNVVGEVKELLSQGCRIRGENLSDTQKIDAHCLVASAFEHWDKVVLFDETALINFQSRLSNELRPSIPRRQEDSSAHDIGNSPTLPSTSSPDNGNDHTQQRTPSPNILSPGNSTGGMNPPSCFPMLNVDVPDFGCRSPSFSFHLPDSLLFPPDSMIDDFDESFQLHSNNNYHFQEEYTDSGSYGNQQGASGEFLLVRAQAVDVAYKAQKRWTKVSCVLRCLRIMLRKGSKSANNF